MEYRSQSCALEGVIENHQQDIVVPEPTEIFE